MQALILLISLATVFGGNERHPKFRRSSVSNKSKDNCTEGNKLFRQLEADLSKYPARKVILDLKNQIFKKVSIVKLSF